MQEQIRSPRWFAITALAVALIVIGVGGLFAGQAFAGGIGPGGECWAGGAWHHERIATRVEGAPGHAGGPWWR